MQRAKRFLKLYKNQVVHGTIILISVILALTVIIPQAGTQIRRFKLMRETESNIQQLKEKQALLDSFESSALDTAYRVTVSTFPKEKILGSMMTGLENLMSDYDVTLFSFSFDTVGSIGTQSAIKKGKKENTIYSIIPITMMVEGKLANIRNFLESLNRTRPLYLVKNFDLSFSPDDNIFRSKLILEAYYLPLPKSLGSVGSKLAPFTDAEKSLLTKISEFPELVRLSGSSSINSIPSSPVKSDPFAP